MQTKAAGRWAMSLLVGICLLGSASAHAAPGKAAIKWARTLDMAMKEAKSSSKLIMVDFYTDWCTWCKELDKNTYTAPKVVQLTQQLVAVKVNAEKEGVAAAKKYGVNGYPTILFLDGDGRVEGRVGGYEPPDAFAASLTKVITSHKEFPAMTTRFKANPNDAEAAEKLTTLYAGRGMAEQAAGTLAKAEKLDPSNAKGGLAAAYNAVGDHYQEAKQYDKAVPLFQKGAKVARKPYDAAYANLSIAACYFEQQKFKQAVPYLQAVTGRKDAPADLRGQAGQMLQMAKQR